MNRPKKRCTNCNDLKFLSDFHRSSTSRDGHKETCKLCRKEEHRIHYLSHKEDYARNSKQWVDGHRQEMRDYHRTYGKTKRRKKYIVSYRIRNRDRRTSYQRFLMHQNIGYRIATYLRHRLGSAIKSQNCPESNKTLVLLGCSMGEFRKHLGSKFLVGMTWANYGKWHIDHIKPCATFDLSLPYEQAVCFHYTNMQPLWAMDNYRKGITQPTPQVGLNILNPQMVLGS